MENGFFDEETLLYKISDFNSFLKENGVNSPDEFEKIFTEKELINISSKYKDRKLFGKFLLKKIITKYLKNDKYIEVEILNNEKGKPYVILHNEAKNEFEKHEIKNIEVSISHSKDWITVMAVFEN